LRAASTLTLPRGTWLVHLLAGSGAACSIQYKDPVRQEWANIVAPAAELYEVLQSDGFNIRVMNVSDAAWGGIVTAAGSGYAQGTTTVTAGTGNSVWQPLIGGAVGAITVDVAGSGYTMTPTVFIPAPPAPGIAATALATLSAGAVSAITVSGASAGAGYLTAPPIVIIPDPTDPALAAGLITNAAAHCVLAGAGTLTGLLLVNFGAPLTTAPTLTVNGAGTAATATTNPATVVAATTVAVTLQPYGFTG
jgi:hypothetical protein